MLAILTSELFLLSLSVSIETLMAAVFSSRSRSMAVLRVKAVFLMFVLLTLLCSASSLIDDDELVNFYFIKINKQFVIDFDIKQIFNIYFVGCLLC